MLLIKGKKGKLSYYIANHSNPVIADYPFETKKYELSSHEKKTILKKLNYFNTKNQILNILPGKYNNQSEWVQFPLIPIQPILKGIDNIGYANIRKQDTGVNRTIPLVAKWEGKIYPSIALVTIAHYYGIDPQKDIKVKLGSYIKIMNIPEKTTEVYDYDSKNNKFVKKKIDIMAKPNKERSITIPIDKEGFMYINFIGGPWSFPSFSFHTIASAGKNAFSKENDPFKNKILLVAMYYATGVARDIHASPFGDTAGIEHHANAINTILKQDFLIYVPNWVNYAIYIIIGIILGFITPRYKIIYVLSGIFLFSLVFALECFSIFNLFNVIHVFFVPYIEIALTTITIIGYRALSEEENVKYIRSTFSKFVSKAVVDELLSNPQALELGGDKKEISIFFSDIRGFTTISESLEPNELVNLLNEYLSAMTEICLQYNGTIDKYMGDAIMAFWGAPLPEREHAYLACLSAIAQLNKLKNLQEPNGDWRESLLLILVLVFTPVMQ